MQIYQVVVIGIVSIFVTCGCAVYIRSEVTQDKALPSSWRVIRRLVTALLYFVVGTVLASVIVLGGIDYYKDHLIRFAVLMFISLCILVVTYLKRYRKIPWTEKYGDLILYGGLIVLLVL